MGLWGLFFGHLCYLLLHKKTIATPKTTNKFKINLFHYIPF